MTTKVHNTAAAIGLVALIVGIWGEGVFQQIGLFILGIIVLGLLLELNKIEK